MSLQNIVLADGSATPVNRTFEVFTPQVGVQSALLLQKAGGVTKLNERLELVQRRSGSGTAYRTEATLRVPRVVDASTNLVETAIIDIRVTIPDGFTHAMRKDVAAYLKNLSAHSTVNVAISDLTSFA